LNENAEMLRGGFCPRAPNLEWGVFNNEADKIHKVVFFTVYSICFCISGIVFFAGSITHGFAVLVLTDFDTDMRISSLPCSSRRNLVLVV